MAAGGRELHKSPMELLWLPPAVSHPAGLSAAVASLSRNGWRHGGGELTRGISIAYLNVTCVGSARVCDCVCVCLCVCVCMCVCVCVWGGGAGVVYTTRVGSAVWRCVGWAGLVCVGIGGQVGFCY